jgi:hypothetical protein
VDSNRKTTKEYGKRYTSSIPSAFYDILSNCRERLEKRNYMGDLEVDGKMTLDRILRKEGVRIWTGFNWLRRGPRSGTL